MTALTDADQALETNLRRVAELGYTVRGQRDPASYMVEAADTLATLRARATAAEAERNKLRSDLAAAVILVGEHARARGEAEGRLRVAELPGIVEGWRDRATAAEDKLKDQEAEIERLQGELKQRDHLLALRTRQNTQASQAWARAAEQALAGDPRALHDRLRLHQDSASTDARIVQSVSTEQPASSEEATE